MVTRATHIRRPRRASGLTLVEVLVSLAVLGLMTGIGYPVIQNLMHRAKIDSSARETAGFMRLARLEAIRNSRPVMVVADADNREIVVFVDENFDVLYGPEDQMIGRKDLPAGVFYLEPGGATGVDSVDGFIIDGSLAQAVFLANGSAQANGALRFGDERGNYLEVRVEPFTTAQVTIRKWNGAAWLAQGEGGTTWTWN